MFSCEYCETFNSSLFYRTPLVAASIISNIPKTLKKFPPFVISFSWELNNSKNPILPLQKQPFRGVLSTRCSENMQQIYTRIPVLTYDFKKVAKQLYWNHTSAWVFSCKFAAYFQNSFYYEHIWIAASVITLILFSRTETLHCKACSISKEKLLRYTFPDFTILAARISLHLLTSI